MIPSSDSKCWQTTAGGTSSAKQGSSLLRFGWVEAAQAQIGIHHDGDVGGTSPACVDTKRIAKVSVGREKAGVPVRDFVWRDGNGCEYSQVLEFGSYGDRSGIGLGRSRGAVPLMGSRSLQRDV